MSGRRKFTFEKYYEVESRISNINKMKSKETDDYGIYGWIRVQGTNIDYPLVGLKKSGVEMPADIEKYAWIMPGDNKYHNVVNIQGHNLMNLSSHPDKSDSSFNRFEELMAFVYYDFARENKYIQLTMENKDYLYQIFAAGFIDGYSYNTLPINEYNDNEKKEYLETMMNNSIYDYNLNVSDDDNFITLATCTRFGGSKTDDFYIAGKLVNEENKISNYSVKRNKKYEKVEETLKGDDLNESKSA